MDFWDLSRLLARRWYAFLPMVLVSLLVSAWIQLTVTPDVTATTHVRLLPPHQITVGDVTRDPVNPYLDLGLGSLSELARVSLEGESVARALTSAGYSDTFTITVDQFSPLVTIESVGKTQQQAVGTTSQLTLLFIQSVIDFQSGQGVGKDDLILAERVPVGDKVETSPSRVTRAVIAIGAVGLLLSVGLTIVLDAVANRRRPRPLARSGETLPIRGDGARWVVGGSGGGVRAGDLGGGGLRGGRPGLGAAIPSTPVFTVGGQPPALTAGDPTDGGLVAGSAATDGGTGRSPTQGPRIVAPGAGRGVSVEYRAGKEEYLPLADAVDRDAGGADAVTEVSGIGAVDIYGRNAEVARRDGVPVPRAVAAGAGPAEDDSTILLPLSVKGRQSRDGGGYPH